MTVLSVVIPIYNASSHIEALLASLRDVLRGTDYELILVDDASQDHSGKRLSAAAEQDAARIRVFRLLRRRGQHSATLYGLFKAKGRYRATLDDDLQYSPADLYMLLRRLKKGDVEVVYGMGARKHAAWICIGSQLLRYVLKWTTPIKQPGSSFRMMTHQLVQKTRHRNISYPFIEGLLAQCKAPTAYVAVQHAPQRNSRYSLGSRTLLAIQVLMHYSYPMAKLLILGLILGGGWCMGAQAAIGIGIVFLVTYMALLIYLWLRRKRHPWRQTHNPFV